MDTGINLLPPPPATSYGIKQKEIAYKVIPSFFNVPFYINKCVSTKW